MRQTNGRFADRGSVKGGGFERQGGGVLHDLGVETAHDAGDRHRRVVVADHQGVFVHMALYAVEGLEFKRRIKALDADLFDLARIERVHGLTHFEHEVVGEVGEEVDGTHAAVIKTDAHVDRADGALDVLHLQAGIAVAERILDLQINLFQRVIDVQILGVERLERSAGKRGKLARDAVVTPEVGAVGEGLVVHLKNDVVDLIDGFEVGAVGDIVGDLHDAGVVVADADLCFAAAHAVGGVACQLARRNGDLADLGAHLGKGGFHADAHIRRTANHVGQRAVAGVHLEQMQLFGIGMRLHGHDFGDHDAADVAALEEDVILHLGGGKGKLLDQCELIEPREVNKVGDPIH